MFSILSISKIFSVNRIIIFRYFLIYWLFLVYCTSARAGYCLPPYLKLITFQELNTELHIQLSSSPEHFRVQLDINWFYLLLIISCCFFFFNNPKGLFSRESGICLVYTCLPNFSLNNASTFSTPSTFVHLFPFCPTPSTGQIWELTLTYFGNSPSLL